MALLVRLSALSVSRLSLTELAVLISHQARFYYFYSIRLDVPLGGNVTAHVLGTPGASV